MDVAKMRRDWVASNYKAKVSCECGHVFPVVVTKQEWYEKKCVIDCPKCGSVSEKTIIGLIEI